MQKKTFESYLNQNQELTQAHAGEDLFKIFREPLIEEMNVTREQLKNLKYSEEQKTDSVNILIFGPSGAGKSSLIQSF